MDPHCVQGHDARATLSRNPMMVDFLHNVRHIHLVGICGTAMASLAGMLQGKGVRITGSDRNAYPPMSTFLQDLGIAVFQGFSESHLRPPPDLVVIGNAVSRGNPEVEFTLNEKIPYCSLAEILKEVFIRGKTSVVVTGTHGKTTTAALLAWLLESAGYHPSFLIGGIARNFHSSFQITDGQHFVIEGDEYDTAFFDKGPKFLHYLPDVVIFNNCEYDHADIYPDFAAVQQSFRRLLNIIPSKGALIAGWDDAVVRRLSRDSPAPVVSFGTRPGTQWTAASIQFLEQATRFEAFHLGERWGQFEIPLAGSFNVKNALAALICAHQLGGPLPGSHRPGVPHLQEREATAGGQGRNPRHHDFRRFRPSSDSHRRHLGRPQEPFPAEPAVGNL